MDYRIKTPCGEVQGCSGRVPGTAAYKGIRYASAGRWEYPKAVERWEGVYNATAYGSCCYQPRSFYDEEQNTGKVFYYHEFRRGETYRYSEDCLFLNVWTPDTAKEGDKLPVLVYIHGGGFTGGCGHEKHFDGPVWPAKGVIAVTINYRLGPLGFFCHPKLKEEAGFTGNYGLYDQVEALKWVNRNIASFGGDPENVTIMGQSAGAMSVQQLCLSPLTEGLFCKAVMSSGGGVSKMLSASLPEKQYEAAQALMESAGCKDLQELRALSPEALFDVWGKQGKKPLAAPCLDGRLIVGTGVDLLKSGKQHRISYLCGITSEDIMPPILFKMARGWCAAQEKPSYAWFFDRKLPGDDKGAWHSSDLWYWFGTLDNGWRPWEEKDRQLSEQMVSYLMNFAKTGDPNGDGLPRWTPMEQKGSPVLRIGEGDTRMGKPSTWKLIHTMLTNKAVGE